MNSQTSSGEPRRPSSFLYALACFYTQAVFGLKHRLTTDSSAIAGVEPPVLVLCNHEANNDFLIAANALRPLKLNFMVTTYFFHHSLLGRLLRFMGCIPKRQFLSDPAAIKAVIKVIGRGGSVCVFPEGQVCYAGRSNRIDASIGKLAKKLGVTVLVHTVRGNYLTAPKWACGRMYKGRVESRAEILLTPDELRELSVERINERITRALEYDEFEWQRVSRVPYKPERAAEGAENVLYRCPDCEREFTMRAEGRSLVCEGCGYTASFDEYGFFMSPDGSRARFETMSRWYRWQYERAETEFVEGFEYSAPCSLARTVEGRFGYSECGSGVMTADSRGLRFMGERLGEPFELAALVERQSNVTHNAASCAVDIEGPDANYALAPEDKRRMMKFVILYQIARARFESEKRV